MKIGVIIDKIYPFYSGGYENRYWEIYRRLAKRHEIHIFSSCYRDMSLHGIKFHKVVPKISYELKNGFRDIKSDFFFTLNLAKYLRNYNFDIIDCNSIPYFLLTAGKILAFENSCPLVSCVHEPYKMEIRKYLEARNFFLKDFVSFISNTISSRFLQLPDMLISVSSVTERRLKENGFDNVITIPNGIKLKRIDTLSADVCLDSDEYFSIVYLSRLVPKKRPSVLIRAVADLLEAKIPVRVDFIGDGPSKGALKDLADNLGIRKYVKFHGFVSERIKYRLLKKSDVFVLPSKQEGFSISTLEAMACETTPLIVDPNSGEGYNGALDYVIDGYNGLTFDGTKTQLVKKLQLLIPHDKMRKKFGTKSRETSEKYKWNLTANQVEEEFRRIS